MQALLLGMAWLQLVLSQDFLAVVSLSKTLYIPGQYYSLINFTHSVASISDYFNITMGLTIEQVGVGVNRKISVTRVTRCTTCSSLTRRTIRGWSRATRRQ